MTVSGETRGETRVVGPYRLMDVLGRGGMGVVHRAVHVDSGAVVALKTVTAMRGRQLAGLRAEIRSLARLDHPGIVRIVDDGAEDGSPWYAMELIEGRTLADHLDALWERNRRGDAATLPSPSDRDHLDGIGVNTVIGAQRLSIDSKRVAQLMTILRQLCEALAYVHHQGMIHRDIKPSNIFLRARDQSTVLMDFGLVSRFRPTSSRDNLQAGAPARVGTLAYMAPEQLRGQQIDARADLYSLGCVAYEFLTGRAPYDRPTAEDFSPPHVVSAPRPSEAVDGLPPVLDDLVAALLAGRPQDRLGYAADVLDVLDTIEPMSADITSSGAVRTTLRSYLYRPRLVGRAQEMDELWQRVSALQSAGEGAAIFIGGESGSGKTMLANQLGLRAAQTGLCVVGGECLPLVGESTVVDPRESPLHPFRPFLRMVADYCRTRPPEVTERLLGTWGRLLAMHEPELANLPGLEQAPSPSHLVGEATRDRSLGALRDVLVAFSQEEPLLLVLDDLQWADELSLSCLRSLSPDFLRAHRIVVVGTYRTEEVSTELAALIAHADAVRVSLPRLDVSTIASITGDMLGMARPPDALISYLVKTSEGNPFFLTEYLRAAVVEGVLVREAGRWHVSGHSESRSSAYEEIELPRSLRGLIARRIAGLSPGALALAADAAVLGRMGKTAVLRRMSTASPDDFAPALAELVARHIVDLSDGKYSFLHDKIREATFDHFDAPARREIHLRAARALETSTDADESPLEPFQLAYHYRCAGHTQKAFSYARAAGERAMAAGAFRESCEHLGGALKVLEADPDVLIGLDVARERARLQRLLGEARVVSGQLRDGIDTLRQACNGMGVPAPARHRVVWIGRAMFDLGRLIFAAVLPRRWSVPPQGSVRKDLEEAAEMNRLASMAYLFLGQSLECVCAEILSTRLARQSGGAHAQKTAGYSFLASACGMAGLPGLEARLFEAARAAARASDGVIPLIWERTVETVFQHYRNANWRAMEESAAPAILRASENNLIYDRQPLEFMLSIAQFEQGSPQAAQRALEQVLALALNFGHEVYVVSARGTLMLYDLYAGLFPKIIREGPRVAEMHRAEKLDVDLFAVLTALATAYSRVGDQNRAEVPLKEALAFLKSGARLEARPIAVRALYDFADLLCSRWQRELEKGTSARQAASQAIWVCRKLSRLAGGRPHIEPAALHQQARIQLLKGRPARARKLLARAIASAQKLGMPPFEALARFSLAQVQTLPMPERLDHLDVATTMFRKMGFSWHLERAEALARNLGGSPPIRPGTSAERGSPSYS